MYKIIVASIPRTGSTMLTRALADLPVCGSFDQKLSSKVYKTHLYEHQVKKCKKAIFLFGKVEVSVISMRKFRWDKQSLLNCQCPTSPQNTNIYVNDACNFEKIYDSWTHPKSHTVLAVRYEKIWKYKNLIQDFVGWNFTLPPRRPRLTYLNSVSPQALDQIRITYKSLINKVNKAKDIQIYNG